MRIHKYRAWDKIEKKFYYFTLDKLLERRMCYHGSWDHKVLEGEKTQFTGLYDNTKWKELTEKERNQWTKDGNMPSEWDGREIYNGDILEYKDESGTIERHEVEWLLGGWWCAGQPMHELKLKEYWTVIGNKFQNPELLGGTKE